MLRQSVASSTVKLSKIKAFVLEFLALYHYMPCNIAEERRFHPWLLSITVGNSAM